MLCYSKSKRSKFNNYWSFIIWQMLVVVQTVMSRMITLYEIPEYALWHIELYEYKIVDMIKLQIEFIWMNWTVTVIGYANIIMCKYFNRCLFQLYACSNYLPCKETV